MVACYPKQSPDVNAIEGWWKVLRDRLDLTAPEEIESREEFVTRLRRTVAWLDINDREHAVALARNQQARALFCIRKAPEPNGEAAWGLQCVNPCTSTARVMFRPCSTHVPHMFHTWSTVIRSMFHSSLR